jgi:hypothetical protein
VEDIPIPTVWDQIENKEKIAVVEVLARLIAKMIAAEKIIGGVRRDG